MAALAHTISDDSRHRFSNTEHAGLDEPGDERAVTYEELRSSKIYSQTLPGYMPMYSPGTTIVALFILGPIFIGIGIALHAASDGVVETATVRYDNDESCNAKLRNSPCVTSVSSVPVSDTDENYVPQNPLCWRNVSEADQVGFDNKCDIRVTIPEDMKAPIFFYYQLTDFYQNQRVYVKSQAPFQLKGGKDDGRWKDRAAYQQDLRRACIDSGFDRCETGAVKAIDQDGHETGKYLCNPCGLIARSFFTDTFEAAADGEPLTGESWTQDGIAWTTDTEDKYAATDDDNTFNKRLPDEDDLVTDPDFIVWMRTAGLPTFRKLYRVINRDLKKGTTLTVSIRNNYDVSSFDGQKAFVLSTVSWMGGKNPVFVAAYLGFGALLTVLAVVFLVLEMTCKKPALQPHGSAP